MARVDAWLWAVRVYKTRSVASSAVKGGHVRVNDLPVKPAYEVKTGDVVRIRREAEERILEVVDPTMVKRVGAAVAAHAFIDRTPEKPPPILEMMGRVAVRDRGAGRPTKRDRRAIDRLRDR